MSPATIIQVTDLGYPWAAPNPFIFCAYFQEVYPRGNANMGPDVPLQGRNLGNDWSQKDHWSMYHGTTVPGFPAHPHRGFETVTITRQGFVDHADSLGATARYGEGDVQWLTTGRGIVHSEMFPLLNTHEPNSFEMFQIWLNLPRRAKMAEPRFTMYWAESMAKFDFGESGRRRSTLTCVAGQPESLSGQRVGAPPLDSWAAQPDADVAIWTVKMAPMASLTLPRAVGARTRRTLYFFRGDTLRVADTDIHKHSAIEVRADTSVDLHSGNQQVEVLVLQGCPIGEPVMQRGPFVMNTPAEIIQAMDDYQRTRFGSWSWPDDAPVHPRAAQRFAQHPDGRHELPATARLSPTGAK
jgi:redox-sensitive bicupin YhaK (pirin superfamily)